MTFLTRIASLFFRDVPLTTLAPEPITADLGFEPEPDQDCECTNCNGYYSDADITPEDLHRSMICDCWNPEAGYCDWIESKFPANTRDDELFDLDDLPL